MKRRDHVLRDVRKILISLYGEDRIQKLKDVYQDTRERKQSCYYLCKREARMLTERYQRTRT